MSTTSSDLTLNTSFEYPKYASSQAHKTIFMSSIMAPKFESEQRKTRSAIDIVAVIDRSGSMGGEKIELVKKTLAFMIDQLKEDDQLSLVTFDTHIAVDVPLGKMNTANKSNAKNVIKAIYAGDSTNLSGGILQGFDIIKSRTVKNNVVSMLVFTDGQANVGVTNKDQLTGIVEKCVADSGVALSLYTFGFGNDHDALMLTKMATAGNGLYYYLQSEEEIPDSFANCLGGLLSVVAQNITLTIKSDTTATITQALSSFKKLKSEPNQLVLQIGDLYSEERRDVVVEVQIPAIEEASDSYAPFDIEMKYFDVIDTSSKTITNKPSIARPNFVASDTNTVNTEVDKQKNRVLAVKAMAEARELANKNQLGAARQVLQQAISVNTTSATKSDDYTKALNQDLASCMDQMVDTQTYNSTGSKWINQNWSSNAMQRVTTTKSAVQAAYYQQPQQQAMQQDFSVLKSPSKPTPKPTSKPIASNLPFQQQAQQQQQQSPWGYQPSPFQQAPQYAPLQYPPQQQPQQPQQAYPYPYPPPQQQPYPLPFQQQQPQQPYPTFAPPQQQQQQQLPFQQQQQQQPPNSNVDDDDEL